MAEGDFSVYAKIQADTSNFEKGMKKAQNSANSLSSAFSNVSKVITKALSFAGLTIGTKAIVDFGKACVASANQANTQFRILDNTIKATGADAWTSSKEMSDMAKNLSNSTSYSVTEIERMQSVLLGFRDITGETFEEASNAILDMATVMGMDLTSAVQTVGKALDDPIKGLDSLRRQGFQFTDQQKAELAQLIKTGDKIKAQKIILDELARTYGGASKAGQDSFAKQRHAVEEFREVLGNKLMPTVKMFAENSSIAFNSLTKIVEKIDFNKISAIAIASFNKIKGAVSTLSAPFKSISKDLKNFISEIDLKPFISVLETLIGAFKKINEININTGIKTIKSLKDTISGIGENVDLNKIAEVINEIINAFVFLYDEVNKVFDVFKDNVKTLVSNVWNSFKSLFESTNKALADSESDIKSWKDFFYEQFNNAFKIIQDVVYSIKAIMNGDWKLAWKYAKLAFLRVIDSITSGLNTMVTAFHDKVKTIMKIVEVIDLLTPDIFGGGAIKGAKLALKSVDKLIEKSKDANDKIKDVIIKTEDEIKAISGANDPDKNLKDLKNYVSGSKGVLGKFVDNFKEATEQAKKELDNLSGEYKPGGKNNFNDDVENTYAIYSEWDSKLLQQKLDNLKEWQEEYHKINLQLIEEERKKALEADKTGAETEKINAYYNQMILNEEKRHSKSVAEEIKKLATNLLESDSELLKRKQENLKEYSREYHKINLQLIEVERKKELLADTSGANTKKINAHYDKQILNEKKRYLTAVFEVTKKAIKKIIEVWKSLVTAVKKVFSTIISVVKNAWNVLSKLFDFNIDEALEKILEFEDKILTFFVETLPKMPAFVKSVLESIGVLFKNLIQTIDKDGLSSLIQEMISSLMTALPGLLKDLIKIGSEIVIGLVDGITKSMPDIFNALYEIKDIVIETLRNMIPLINKLLTDSLPLITDIFFNIVNTVFENFPKVIDDLISILPKLVEAVVNNLPRLFEESLPKLVNGIVDLIPTIFSASGQLIKGIIQAVPTIISALIRGIVDMLENLDANKISQIISAIISMIGDIANGIIQSISSIITELIPALIKLIVGLVQKIPDILSGLVTGTVEGFGKLGNDVVKGFKSAGESVSGFFTDLFTGKFFADGTNSAPKGLAIVGEAGPELVNFRGGEKVYNNTNTEKMLSKGSGGNTFNVNFYETKDTTAYTMMKQLRAYQRNLAFNGVL